MTSLQTRIRQNGPQFFMPVSSLAGLILAYNPTVGVANQFSVAPWADNLPSALGNNGASGTVGLRGPARYLSSINVAGQCLLKDIGKNVVSAGRTFRKIQLVVRQNATTSTGGVEGNALATNPNADYLTGYIEFGFEGTGQSAPVVQYGTL
jgi:hypothetical protein